MKWMMRTRSSGGVGIEPKLLDSTESAINTLAPSLIRGVHLVSQNFFRKRLSIKKLFSDVSLPNIIFQEKVYLEGEK